MALPDEVKSQIDANLAEGSQRVLAAEMIALALLTDSVERASDRVAKASLAGGTDARAAVVNALLAEGTAFQRGFASQVLLARAHGRELGRGQVVSEFERGFASFGVEPPAVAEAEQDESDLFEADRSSSSMRGVWTTAVLVAADRWASSKAPLVELPQRISAVPAELAPRLQTHAAFQGVESFARSKRDVIEASVGGGAKGGGGASNEVEKREPGLPYGHKHGVHQVWSAVLDRVTCPVCWGLDGKVVLQGKSFPGGYTFPPVHPLCRCILCTIVIPPALRRKLAGVGIDYDSWKDEVAHYFRNAKPSLRGVRHAEDYVREALGTTSPETLTRWLESRTKRAPRQRPRAPKLPQLPGASPMDRVRAKRRAPTKN